jgi:hypothetical protein
MLLARARFLAFLAFLALTPTLAFAATTGRITGTVKDQSGAIVMGVAVTVTNTTQGIETKAITDVNGTYSFPSLPIGRYQLTATVAGFQPERRTGLVLDIDSVLQVDITLKLTQRKEEVTVRGSDAESEVRVETVSTEMGEVVGEREMTAVALNGRAYTDLLALQPGIVPMSTQQPNSIVMAGASVAIAPSGGLNPGNQSVSGQREDANGFIVNGGDVKELMNGGTLIVPNLDSIAEFRVLTNNVDAQYGNYSGGIVNVVTKSGTNARHGSAFEFLRNTDLDARNFFSPERSFYRQNQFGGTFGGPIRKNKIFFFGDYQGTRSTQGIDTGLIPVPTLAERSGDFSGVAGVLTGRVGGPYIASLLGQKLGYIVSANEPYYMPGCTDSTQCVFPNAFIPQRAWSAPAQHLLPYIPLPNTGVSNFSTSSYGATTRDDKGSFRVDAATRRFGTLTGYYFFDDYRVNNPYPTGQGGASVPGFNALNLGRGQLADFSATKVFGATAVNELRLSYMRSANNVGQPSGGVGPSLASQGFQTGAGTPGIVPLAPSIEGIENAIFDSFVIGEPITNLKQANNTYGASDNFSKVMGSHSLKFGLEASYEQVNVNPDPTFNGSFLFNGTETGSDFADFLIGVASNFNQADSQSYYIRHRYQGGFAQDSWRWRPNLTVNYGIRWDHMEYWSEKYDQIPTFLPGEQSKVYPNALPGLVYPTDPGVGNTLVPSKQRFSPRIGVAWSPDSTSGFWGKLIGGRGKSSVRAGYGIFYSAIEGNTMAIDEPQPPYGLSYTSPSPPLFATPYMSASNGQFLGNPFPLTFPPLNASASRPNSLSFDEFIPLAGMTAPVPGNTYPYSESYFFSIERQVTANTLLSISYVGSQAHHLLAVFSANPGDPALCLKLSNPAAVAIHSPTCGPFGEDTQYITASGQTIQGTRVGLGPDFSNDDYDASVGNSNFNALEVSFRHSGKSYNFSVGYTYSKSIDQGSSISDPLDPYDLAATRALSAFDLKHNFVASYLYQLPFTRMKPRLTARIKPLIEGWSISGIARATSGFPVTLHVDGDNSLQGSIPNGVNNFSLDQPDYNGLPLHLNGNPRNGMPYFNPDAFSPNALGALGNASRRSFYGPGALNFDMALLKSTPLSETKALEFRLEAFNVFNHSEFFGPASVDGNASAATFGRVVSAAAPRLMQVAVKFTF